VSLSVVGIVLVSTFMHASWNLLVREQSGTDIFLRTLLLIAVVGLGPALLAEYVGPRFLTTASLYLLAAGFFQGIYFLGLTLGYRTGQFTIVYPLARALPVLSIALFDIVKGHAPAPLGWLGIGLVSLGCGLLPLESVRKFKLAQYWNKALLWTAVAAGGTVGYTIVDSAAATLVPHGLATALRYGVYETFLSFIAYWLILRAIGYTFNPDGKQANWRRTGLIAALLFGAYGLVLWAYQLSEHTSYVVALRQFSIVLGVVAGGLFLHEPAQRMRVAAALTITLGGVCIALAK
jgi:drug/metabolite transporter (DMT)-like permease